MTVEPSQGERRVVGARELRPEVEHAVAAVDLAPAEGEAIDIGTVHPRLARHGQPEAGRAHQLPLAVAVQA